MFIPGSKMRRHDTDLNLHLGWKGEKGLMCLACIQSKGEGSTGELRLLLAHICLPNALTHFLFPYMSL